VEFDVPAQAATTAIPEFAREANIQILVSANDVQASKRTRSAGRLRFTTRLRNCSPDRDHGCVGRRQDHRSQRHENRHSCGATSGARGCSPIVVQAQEMRAVVAPAQMPPAPRPGSAPAAAAQEIPELVLITGSLIRGTQAVGVPVTNLSTQDFTQTGSITTADLFRTIPAANVQPGRSPPNPANA